MENTPKNYGYVADEILPDHWIAGASAIPDEILIQDGQWDDFLP
jgi:hypothetical protein